MQKRQTRVSHLVFAYGSLFSFGLIDNLRGPAYPRILEDFTIGTSEGSLIFSLASLAGLFVTGLSKYWLPAWGALKSLRVFLILMFLSSMGMGLAALDQGSWLSVKIFSFLFGAAGGGTGVGMNVLVGQVTSPDIRRRAYAGLHANYAIASLLAPTFFGTAVSGGISWPVLFIGAAAIPFSFTTFSLWLKSSQSASSQSTEKEATEETLLSQKIMVGALFGLYVASEIAVSSRLVYYLEKSLGWSVSSSGHALSLFFLCLFLGRISFSLINFSWPSRRWIWASGVTSLLLFLTGLYLWPWALALCGFSMSIFFPCGMDWIQTTFDRHAPAIIAAVMTSVSVFLILMHWGLGVLNEWLPAREAMLIGPFFLVSSLTLFAFQEKRLRSLRSRS